MLTAYHHSRRIVSRRYSFSGQVCGYVLADGSKVDLPIYEFRHKSENQKAKESMAKRKKAKRQTGRHK